MLKWIRSLNNRKRSFNLYIIFPLQKQVIIYVLYINKHRFDFQSTTVRIKAATMTTAVNRNSNLNLLVHVLRIS